MTLNEFVTLHSLNELLKLRDQLRLLVREAMDYGPKDCQQFFDNSDEFCFSDRDSYTGYRHEYPLSEWIKSLTETKKKWVVKKIILNHVTNDFFLPYS